MRLRTNREQARALESAPTVIAEEESPAETDEGELIEDGDLVSAPVSPSADEETAYLPEGVDEMIPPRRASDHEEDEPAPALPELDELMKRVPAGVREKMDELFRAKFVRVQRVSKRSLKS